MKQDQDRFNHKTQSSAVTRALPSILRQVKENSASILSNQLNDFFNSCDDLFFELANHACSNNEQNLYFDSMREIRLKKNEVINTFKERFNLLFSELMRPNISKTATQAYYTNSFDSLDLVENDKMEQEVAISSIVSKTRQDCQENLYHLCLRFDYILPDITVSENNNPLDPKQICETFVIAVSLLEIDLKAKIILYKQFDRKVTRHVNKIYALANELLINAGILPKVVPSIIKKQPTDHPPVKTTTQNEKQQGEQSTANASTEAAQSLHTFSQLRSLLESLRHTSTGNDILGSRINTSAPNYGPAIAQEKLLDELNNLQKEFTSLEAPPTKKQFQTAIYQILQTAGENGKPSSLGQTDEDVINLVAMFFEVVLDDRNLPVPIQALIGRLQIPVLKIALKDNSFFNNSTHPARILINEIADVSIGWSNTNKAQQDELYDLINDIVHKINDEFIGDCAVIEKELDRLKAFKQKESKRSKIVESRTNQAAEGKAKTDHAREIVQNTLLQRLNNQAIPDDIKNFLITQWQKVLVLVRLKSGGSSPEWLSALQAVDDLVWVAKHHQNEKSIKRAARIQPSLIEALRQGLTLINLPEDEISKSLSALDDTLTQVKSGEAQPETTAPSLKAEQLAALGQTQNGTTKSWKEMSALERQQVKQKALQFEFLKKAETLKVGTWLQSQNPDSGKTARYKLASYIKPNERFVFVNRFGQKVAEKNKSQVALELQKEILKPLDSGLLFDRAMTRIVENLKKVGPGSVSQAN